MDLTAEEYNDCLEEYTFLPKLDTSVENSDSSYTPLTPSSPQTPPESSRPTKKSYYWHNYINKSTSTRTVKDLEEFIYAKDLQEPISTHKSLSYFTRYLANVGV